MARFRVLLGSGGPRRGSACDGRIRRPAQRRGHIGDRRDLREWDELDAEGDEHGRLDKNGFVDKKKSDLNANGIADGKKGR